MSSIEIINTVFTLCNIHPITQCDERGGGSIFDCWKV